MKLNVTTVPSDGVIQTPTFSEGRFYSLIIKKNKHYYVCIYTN